MVTYIDLHIAIMPITNSLLTLTTLGNHNSDVIIAGDYNIDLLKINDKPMFSDYFDAITSLSFFPKIAFPTRFTDTNCTLIDNFICKLSHRISNLQQVY